MRANTITDLSQQEIGEIFGGCECWCSVGYARPIGSAVNPASCKRYCESASMDYVKCV